MSRRYIVVDDAHQIMSESSAPGSEYLSREIISCVDNAHHEKTRLYIASQEARNIPTEVLERCTAAILHAIHSPTALEILTRHLPSFGAVAESIQGLRVRDAVLLSSTPGLQSVTRITLRRTTKVKIDRNRASTLRLPVASGTLAPVPAMESADPDRGRHRPAKLSC